MIYVLPEVCQNSIESMPRRIEAVIKARHQGISDGPVFPDGVDKLIDI